MHFFEQTYRRVKNFNATRKVLERNKHSNYGEHIHLFTCIVRCPTCGKILSSTNSSYIIFASSKIMEMDSIEQNRVALYLFNSINFKIKNCKSLDI